MKPSRLSRLSQAPPPNVNLYCIQCDSQIGIFDNEWIRLTSSYARAKDKGTHFGTDVGQKTQTVPPGVAQKAAEGLEMAEVFCKKCSATVGQFCKSAPNLEKQHMVNCFFYKTSRTYLRDAQTSQKIDPTFCYSGEAILPPPRPSATPQASLPPAPRWSQTPLYSRTPGQTPSSHRLNDGNLRRQSSLAMYSTPADVQNDNIITERLAELERRMIDHETTLIPRSERTRSSVVPDIAMEIVNQASEATAMVAEHEKLIADQNDQISALMHQVSQLQSTVNSYAASPQETRSVTTPLRLDAPEETDITDSFELMCSAVRDARSNSEELRALREENMQLKARFSTIANAMGMFVGDSALTRDDAETGQGLNITNVLGKRKREGEQPVSSSLRLSHSLTSRESRMRQSFDVPNQIPTPQSSGPSNDGEGDMSPSEETHSQQDQSITWRESNQPELDRGVTGCEQTKPARDLPPRLEATLMQPAGKPDYFTHQSHNTAMSDQDNGNFPPFPARSTQDSLGAIAHQVREPSALNEVSVASNDKQLSQEPLVEMEIGNTVDFSDDEPLFAENTSTVSMHLATSDLAGHEVRSSTTKDTAEVAFPSTQNDENTGKEQSDHPTTRQSRRRVTESVMSHIDRSTAPSISVAPSTTSFDVLNQRRRMLANKKDLMVGLDNICITTPDDFRREIETREKPKTPKERLQTTEKLLAIELEELGLSEWIDKDKKSPKYKAAVEEARNRRREKNKLDQLASRGVKINPVAAAKPRSGSAVAPTKSKTRTTALKNSKSKVNDTTDTPEASLSKAKNPTKAPTTRRRRLDKTIVAPEDEDSTPNATFETPKVGCPKPNKSTTITKTASSKPKTTVKVPKRGHPNQNSVTKALNSGPLKETKTKQGKPAQAAEPEKAAVPNEGLKTRRQLRQEEIRMRDQLAKEAMEREEMA